MSPFFRSVIVHDELASTSDLARELVADGSLELPFAIRAYRQTRGRGRGDHVWWSDEGSLTFTIAFDPVAVGISRRQEPQIALAAAVAIIRAFERILPPDSLAIRWPNDVEAKGRKVAGILPERFDTSSGTCILVGVGVNVSSRLKDAPEVVMRMAASLRDLGATCCDADAVFQDLLTEIPNVLRSLANNDPGLPKFWAERDALFGQPVRLKLGEVIERGIGAGIDRDGALVLSNNEGTKTHHGGQVLRDHP